MDDFVVMIDLGPPRLVTRAIGAPADTIRWHPSLDVVDVTQPRLVLRVIRRLETIEAWCLRTRAARERQAQEILRTQARAVGVVQALATAARLGGER